MRVTTDLNLNFCTPTEHCETQPTYYVFFWGPVEEVEGGESQRRRWSHALSEVKGIREVLRWAQSHAEGRDYAVMLGVEEAFRGEIYTRLFILEGDYPPESEYDGWGLSGVFYAPECETRQPG